jgi:hypothetical protein
VRQAGERRSDLTQVPGQGKLTPAGAIFVEAEHDAARGRHRTPGRRPPHPQWSGLPHTADRVLVAPLVSHDRGERRQRINDRHAVLSSLDQHGHHDQDRGHRPDRWGPPTPVDPHGVSREVPHKGDSDRQDEECGL